MKILFIPLLLIITVVNTFGQSNKPLCKCAASQYTDTKPDTIFNLSNNVSIALCGYRETEEVRGKILFSEFVLSVCGSKKIIDFWGAVKLCNVRALKDTLFVETLTELPIGKNMTYKKAIWTVERFYFIKSKLKRDLMVNPAISKYTSDQISIVLKLYDQTKNQNSDKTAELIDKLLISTISGSAKARNLLINFRKKFTLLDGHIFEQYDDAISMLYSWDKKN
jgi:hypothetical protein